MQRVKTSNAVSDLPAKTDSGTPGYYSPGNTETGAKATYMSADSMNTIQEELVALATLNGQTLDTANNGQAAAAITALLQKLKSALEAEISGAALVVSGAITAYAGQTIPSGWLECNGQALSTATYANLFASIGYIYGGSGATFEVPDLRGYFVRGWDDGRGIDGGRAFASVQDDAFKAHTHSMTSATENSGSGSYFKNGPEGEVTLTTESAGGVETRPKNIALLYIIKV